MPKLLILLILFPFTGNAQANVPEDKRDIGIHFETGKDWQQIQARAKNENKYIFIDCFTTWCGPCKLMDKEVYPKENVGDFMNSHFISAKVQMDTASEDNEEVRKWYKSAQNIRDKFRVETYPTFLFFSPDGKIVHRSYRALRDTDFINVARSSLNPDKQYYTLLENYLHGFKNYSKLLYLANTTKDIGNKELANIIAKDYIQNYLNKQNDEVLYSKINIAFCTAFIQSLNSKDNLFNFFYEHSDSINNIMGWKGFSESIIRYIISKEEINPKLCPDNKPCNKTPNWTNLSKLITKKYNAQYSEHIILEAKIKWYNERKNWPEVTKYTVQKIEKYGLDTAGLAKYITNNILYEVIFKHSKSKKEINKAIHWMEIIVKSTPDNGNTMDTYASLLYKIGRTKEALEWEEKALKLMPDNTDIQNTLKKMKEVSIAGNN